MASTLADLIVNIGVDTEDLRKGLRSAQRSAVQWGRSMQRAGRNLTLGLTLPLGAAGAAAVKFASDAEETTAKVRAVFKETTSTIDTFAQNFADAANRSRFSLLRMAASFQDVLVPLGFAREVATGLSQRLSRLAVNVASFNNQADARVAENFKSALVGQSRAVLRYGANLRKTRVKQILLNQGFSKGAAESNQLALVLARIVALLRDTQDAQGDAIRTSESFQNLMKGLLGTLKETAVAIGKQLVPILKPYVKLLTDSLDTIKNLDAATIQWGIETAAIAAAIGPVLLGLGTLLVVGGKTAGMMASLVATAKTLTVTLAGLAGISSLSAAGFLALGAAFLALMETGDLAFVNLEIAILGSLNAIVDAAVATVNKLSQLFGGPRLLDAPDLFRERINDLVERSKELEDASITANLLTGDVGGAVSALGGKARGLAETIGSGLFEATSSLLSGLIGDSLANIKEDAAKAMEGTAEKTDQEASKMIQSLLERIRSIRGASDRAEGAAKQSEQAAKSSAAASQAAAKSAQQAAKTSREATRVVGSAAGAMSALGGALGSGGTFEGGTSGQAPFGSMGLQEARPAFEKKSGSGDDSKNVTLEAEGREIARVVEDETKDGRR